MSQALLRTATGATFVLEGGGPWLLGRAADAAVAFTDDPATSRQQAIIRRAADGFLIENLSHTTPTLLDGQKLHAPVPLAAGAQIAFGQQRLIFTPAEAENATIIAPPPPQAEPALPHYTRLTGPLTIGRQPGADTLVIDHPSVSRRHARIAPDAGGAVLRDLGSLNGSFVNGARVTTARLAKGDVVQIGPAQLHFDGAGLALQSSTGNAALSVIGVCRDVTARAGKQRILDNASVDIAPRQLVCIIGASGSGKSTLMNIMAGRARPDVGSVLLNGQDLHANFLALKQDIAFVPQQDTLHEQLTLRQALDYAAQLRLPPDTTAAQRAAIVAEAARSVDLEPRLDNKIASLSGGQKKRASLAAEILSRPSVLFLDEVTSGLDEATDWEIMRLLRRLADEGMTIVAVTHTLANVEEFCHGLICMGPGGLLCFAGPPADARHFFGIARLGQVFQSLAGDGAARWRGTFATAQPPAASRAAPPPPPAPRVGLGKAAARIMRQFAILTHRNIRLLLADRRTLGMAAAQSLLIGGLIGYAFGSFGTGLQRVTAANALLLLLGLCAIWLGCNSASKDIVGERVIFLRERDVNLATSAFVMSKYVVSGVFTMIQLAVAFGLVACFAEAVPGRPAAQLVLLLIGAAAGTAIGLVISAFADTRDQATTIVPLALVPQLVLAGVLVPKLPAFAVSLAKVAVSGYWLTEAMKSVYIDKDGPIQVMDAATGQLVDMTAQRADVAALIIMLHAIAFLAIAYVATLLRGGKNAR